MRLRALAAPLLALALALAGCVQDDVAELPAVSPAAAQPEAAACRVVHVTDGDTVDLACAGYSRERTRLVGFDTPEVFSPGCHEEERLGRQATARLRQLVREAGPVEADRIGHDRYGRLLARVRLDGTDVARAMIAEGLAVPYDGGRRIDWCAYLRA